MKYNFLSKTITVFLLLIILSSCTEPYALQTNTFEEALVVEATLTNELKHQEIKISKTYKLEDNGPTPQTGATVYVTDSNGNEYNFIEDNEKYKSEIEFQAVAGVNYFLNITTNDGKSYISSREELTTSTLLDEVTAMATTNLEGEEGVKIGVNSFDPTNTSKYYRYEYEETYKIIAPKWVSQELVYNNLTGELQVVGKTFLDNQVCYSTDISNSIVLANTNDLSEDRIDDFEILFLKKIDSKIAHRYSILVRQYVQNLAAFTFYKTLKELSGTGSILSQNQPGFFSGNIKSVDNPTEKVIGFFDVSSASSKRIFFNFTDVYPNQIPTVTFPFVCDEFSFDSSDTVIPGGDREVLVRSVNNNTLLYFSNAGSTYNMVLPYCGDCTVISSNVIPSFWE